MGRCSTVILMLLLAGGFLTLPQSFVGNVQALPSVDTNKPLYVRGELMNVTASGFAEVPNELFFWLRWAGTSPQKYGPYEPKFPGGTWVTFDTESLPLGRINVTTAWGSAKVTAFFGIWNTDKSTYCRGETVSMKGGGVKPNLQDLSIDINVVGGKSVSGFPTTISANAEGEFSYSWLIPANMGLGSLVVVVSGKGTYDSSTESFSSPKTIFITASALEVKRYAEPASSYKRMQKASIQYLMTYGGTQPVINLKSGLTPVDVYTGLTKISSVGFKLIDAKNGVWLAEWLVPPDAKLDNYKFVLEENSIDDGSGNVGPAFKLSSTTFRIEAATLNVTVVTNKKAYEILFDSVDITATPKYHDGTKVGKGTATATFSMGDWSKTLPISFDEQSGSWQGNFRFQPEDMMTRSGVWVVKVSVSDGYGNSGSSSTSILVQPWWQSIRGLMILIIVAAVFFTIIGVVVYLVAQGRSGY